MTVPEPCAEFCPSFAPASRENCNLLREPEATLLLVRFLEILPVSDWQQRIPQIAVNGVLHNFVPFPEHVPLMVRDWWFTPKHEVQAN